jgi:hypothetical protein
LGPVRWARAAPVFDRVEVRDVPDAEPGDTDGAFSAEVTAAAALDADDSPLGVEVVCNPVGGVFTGGVLIGGTVTVGVLSVGVVMLGALSVGVVMLGVLTVGVLTVGVLIGPTVTEGTVTGGTVTEGTVTEGTLTDGTDTVGSDGRVVDSVGSLSRDASGVPRATELPRATAVDSAAPASNARHAASAVTKRRLIYRHHNRASSQGASHPMNERVDIAPVLLLARKAAHPSLQHPRRAHAGIGIARDELLALTRRRPSVYAYR